MRAPRRSRKPSASALAGAHLAGALTYQGAPCLRGHSGRRYTSTRVCVGCAEEQVRDRKLAQGAAALNTLLSEWYPQEFDAMGWRSCGSPGGEA